MLKIKGARVIAKNHFSTVFGATDRKSYEAVFISRFSIACLTIIPIVSY